MILLLEDGWSGKRRPAAGGNTRWMIVRASAITRFVDFATTRLAIRAKLENGRLPLERAAKIRGRSPAGEACDGCDTTIGPGQLVMDGFPHRVGSRAMRLHLRCFEIWAQERASLLRERERRTAASMSLAGQPA